MLHHWALALWLVRYEQTTNGSGIGLVYLDEGEHFETESNLEHKNDLMAKSWYIWSGFREKLTKDNSQNHCTVLWKSTYPLTDASDCQTNIHIRLKEPE